MHNARSRNQHFYFSLHSKCFVMKHFIVKFDNKALFVTSLNLDYIIWRIRSVCNSATIWIRIRKLYQVHSRETFSINQWSIIRFVGPGREIININTLFASDSTVRASSGRRSCYYPGWGSKWTRAESPPSPPPPGQPGLASSLSPSAWSWSRLASESHRPQSAVKAQTMFSI